ncbi:hypothetical protein F5Y17DRAFT_151513 [Xylariaceae sp. FL0594]|nr:hypothetical protein F5Y17DRAFT_151513 [Xylariaceae sp. FL0594]
MALYDSRDMRSDGVDRKRAKDHSHKWARGVRPSSGVHYDSALDTWTGSERQQEKVRPERLPTYVPMPSYNINKPRSHRGYDSGSGEVRMPRSKIDALIEMRDPSNMARSLHELLPSAGCTRRNTGVSDDFIYSFDKAESPGKPLSLEIFVKKNTKETEKFVEKEYEILDYNGDAVKGRKALKDLHRGKAMAPPAEEVAPIEDDGFELV